LDFRPQLATVQPNESQPTPGTNDFAICSANFLANFFPATFAKALTIRFAAFSHACDCNNFLICGLYNTLAYFPNPVKPKCSSRHLPNLSAEKNSDQYNICRRNSFYVGNLVSPIAYDKTPLDNSTSSMSGLASCASLIA